jgi:hypothetical protein
VLTEQQISDLEGAINDARVDRGEPEEKRIRLARAKRVPPELFDQHLNEREILARAILESTVGWPEADLGPGEIRDWLEKDWWRAERRRSLEAKLSRADPASEPPGIDAEHRALLSETSAAIARGTDRALRPQAVDVQRRMRIIAEADAPVALRLAAQQADLALEVVLLTLDGAPPSIARPSASSLAILSTELLETAALVAAPQWWAVWKAARLISQHVMRSR